MFVDDFLRFTSLSQSASFKSIVHSIRLSYSNARTRSQIFFLSDFVIEDERKSHTHTHAHRLTHRSVVVVVVVVVLVSLLFVLIENNSLIAAQAQHRIAEANIYFYITF